MTLTKLQNGSDIRGISLTGIPGELPNLTQVETGLLTKGFLIWLCKKTGKRPEALRIAIGRDPRLSGKLLLRAAVNALGPYGVEILDCGIASTPAMFMSTIWQDYSCHGAIMITASHLPYNRNGFKYFTSAGGLDKEDIRQIIDFAQGDFSFLGTPKYQHLSIKDNGLTTYPTIPSNLMDTYANHLQNIIIKELTQLPCTEVSSNSSINQSCCLPSMPNSGLPPVSNSGSIPCTSSCTNNSVDAKHSCNHADYGSITCSSSCTGSQLASRQACFSASDAGNQPLKPLLGLKIVVDAGHGSGGFFATRVLAPLGADISGSQFLEPDGSFPAHMPNPEDREALSQTSLAVLANAADLGLIFDTDVDRSAAIDHRGREIARDGIVALASVLVAKKHPASTVVTDSITTNQLTDFLENTLGLTHLRYMRGYKNVINKGKELPSAYLAIETSGHGAFRDNYFLDDGAYLATLIVIETALLARDGKRLSSLLDELSHPIESKEIRLKINREDFSAYGDEVLAGLTALVQSPNSHATLAEPNFEGVRIDFSHGWCLLRKSLHDPIMALNIASDQVDGILSILDFLRPHLETFSDLDALPLLP